MRLKGFFVPFFMETAELHQLFLTAAGVSTDTRENLKNKIYFALKGENFDGNKFAAQALENGAASVVIDNPEFDLGSKTILVPDVLTSLQKLAAFHRKQLGLPIIAITGSNGKTTTKELVAAVLAQKFKIVFTRGNLNNHIGVPLTLLRMNKDTQMGIVEMGANHQQEIAALCKIAQPDYGYITNFGKAHLEGFGGFEGVIRGKSELYDYLKADDKVIFVNADDEIAVHQSEGGNCFRFGFGESSGCNIKFNEANPFVELVFEDILIKSQLIGIYNAGNIAAAVCMGHYFKVDTSKIKEAVENYLPDNNRSQIIYRGRHKIILDAYNANPTSMRLALESFLNYSGDHKIAVLGDMFEVGDTAKEEHQKIVDLLEHSEIESAFVCGENFFKADTDKVKKFRKFEDLMEAVEEAGIDSGTFLIKGSRGMAMERILQVL